MSPSDPQADATPRARDAELRRGRTAAEPTPCVGYELAGRAEALLAAQAMPNTRRTYASAYRSLLRFIGPGTLTLFAHDIDDWTRVLRCEGKAESTIAVYRAAARLLLADGGSVAAPRDRDAAREVVAPPSPAQIERLREAPDRTTVRGLRDRAVISLVVRTGLGAGEVARLERSDLAAMSRAPGADPGDAPGQRRSATRPVDPGTRTALAAWLRSRPPTSTSKGFTSLPVIAGRHPGPLTARDVVRIIERHADAVGLVTTERIDRALVHARSAGATGPRPSGTADELERSLTALAARLTDAIEELDALVDRAGGVDGTRPGTP
jgi:integrase